nr:hypothetical protein [Tanacetum cinerariifolium]
MPKYTIKSTNKAALNEYDQKSALYQTMHENKSFNRNPANHRLYHALIKALIEDENAMDKGVTETGKDHKRKHDDDDDPSAGPNHGKKTKRRRTKDSESSKKPSSTKETPKGKAPSKGSKTGKPTSIKESVEEPIAEVVMNDTSEDVKILGVKSVNVKKLHGYGHLEEVVVKRANRQLCKFKEGDFMDLHLNDIEDMLLLTLGVESYQMKLNITPPQHTFLEIKFKELYTPSYKPPGVIYEDLAKQKRVMRADELYKFSDGTLKKVQDELHHRILNFRLGYNDDTLRRK